MYAKHITLQAGVESIVELPEYSAKICVKNFTEDTISVSLDEKKGEDNYLDIPKQCAQVICEDCGTLPNIRKVYIVGIAAGEVEVSVLC